MLSTYYGFDLALSHHISFKFVQLIINCALNFGCNKNKNLEYGDIHFKYFHKYKLCKSNLQVRFKLSTDVIPYSIGPHNTVFTELVIPVC